MVSLGQGVKENKEEMVVEKMEKMGRQKSKPDVIRNVWKTGVVTFAKNTSLHGVQFLVSKVGFTRKGLWFLLVLLCSSYLSVQVVERVLQYYQYPITVNVRINFNKTLAFPSLTICNQNAFRATAAFDSGVYGMIEDLFTGNISTSAVEGDRVYISKQRDNIDIRELYRMTAHSKEDLIVECKWQDTYCGPENFTEVTTDHGVCYTFNHELDNPLWISSAGSEHGIKLTLNAEQYEYMPGPHDAAGVKILLHDGKEFPSVANLGLSIPTGAHAYVGMQLVRVENLPKPHGTCSSESSPYYKTYSHDACQLACFTEFMITECGCRDMYMPHLGEYPPVCTVDQYINCFKRKEAIVHRRVEEECICPVPCNFLIYDSTISFSATSEYAHERLLEASVTDSLQQKYLNAREITSRVNPMKFHPLLKLEKSAHSNFQELETVMKSVGLSHISVQKEALENIFSKVKAMWERKSYLLQWQEYIVVKNFIRARQAMEERTLFSALLGFQDLAYQVEIRIHQMVHPPSNLTLNNDVRLNLYLDIQNMINGRIDLCEKAIKNYTQLYYAYRNGKQIFFYQFKEESRDDNKILAPKPLLIEALDRNDYTRKYSKYLDNNLRDVQKFLRMYSAIANTSYANNTLNETHLHYVNVQYFNRARRFYNSRGIFYKDSVEYPEKVLKSKILDFQRLWHSFETDYYNLLGHLNSISSNLALFDNSIIRRIKQGMDLADEYINYGSITKQRVADKFTSEEMHSGINDLKEFFLALKTRGQSIYDGWSALLRSTLNIWDVVINDENMHEYYVHKNMTEWLRDFENVSRELEEDFGSIRDKHDPRFIVEHVDTSFLNSMVGLIEHLDEYKKNNRLNSKFVKDNFIQLDVFYREKSYEQITQQEAYDIFALICDIGGSMGLFIGASVLTLYEILELFLHVLLMPPVYRMCRSLRGKKNKENTN